MSAVKFTFDNDFNPDGPADARLKEEEINAMREQAYQQGVEAGRQEVLAGLEQQGDMLLQNIAQSAQVLQSRHEEQMAGMHKEAATLAHAIISKLAPALVENTPLSEIEMLVEQCLKNSPLEPRLVVRVDEKMLGYLEKKIDRLKEIAGYSGQVVLIADHVNHISDCRVEWADGGAERDFEALNKTIERTLELFIDGSPSDNSMSVSASEAAPEQAPQATETPTEDPLVNPFEDQLPDLS